MERVLPSSLPHDHFAFASVHHTRYFDDKDSPSDVESFLLSATMDQWYLMIAMPLDSPVATARVTLHDSRAAIVARSPANTRMFRISMLTVV